MNILCRNTRNSKIIMKMSLMNVKSLLAIGMLLCVLLRANGQAQLTISSSISTDSIMGKVYLPIDGMPHRMDDVEGKCITIYGKDNRHRVPIPVHRPEFVSLSILGNLTLDLFIEPGDDVEILVSQASCVPSLVFRGSNAAGHALYQGEKPKVNDRLMLVYKQDLPAKYIISEFKDWDSATRLKFQQLREKSLISGAFEKSMVARLQVDYLTGIYRSSQAKLKDPNRRDSTIFLLNTLNSFIDVFRPQYAFDFFPLMVKSTYLNQGVVKDASPKYALWDSTSSYKHYNYIPFEKQGALIGNVINFFMDNSNGEIDVDRMLKTLKANFPKSEYIPILEKRIVESRSKQAVSIPNHATLKYANGKITILDSGLVRPINELLKVHFKQQPVYIDLWALWCGGCLYQIKNTPPSFHPFMEKNGINVLYIFMDRAQAKNRWASHIQQYNMVGHHVHVDEEWMADFKKQLGVTVKGIPRFLLIGKDGKLLLDDCHGPKSSNELYNQLKKALNIQP